MTTDELKALKVGDSVEAGPLLGGLTDSPLLATLVEAYVSKAYFRFDLTLLGVRLGTARAGIKAGKVTWTWGNE